MVSMGVSNRDSVTAVVYGASGSTQLALWNDIDSTEDVDEPTNWAEHDERERADRDARLEELERTQRICEDESQPFFFLREWVRKERQELNAKVYAPE